jgi:hypothetical protein
MPGVDRIAQLEAQLNDFDPAQRSAGLAQLSAEVTELPVEKLEVNLHYHTFFSFNANGWSPTRIAWEARKYGLAVAGIVDFDVLDGMEEFLEAGDMLNLRSTVAMETRVFINDLADQVMSSPNEPGIAYFMAAGCFRPPEPSTPAGDTLASMREMARRRNVQVMEKVNEYLDKVRLDYESDVVPLTPSGNATERHMLAAYDRKAREVLGDGTELATFWANALNISNDEAATLIGQTPRFHETMRTKLMKFGSVGYVAPTAELFPTLERVVEMIHGIEAIPMIAWLDGTNSGEEDAERFLELLDSKGVEAMNIIPDRNWNLKDADEKELKVRKLGEAVATAKAHDFPLCVGTEMNKSGLPFVDNFNAPELRPFVPDFLDGAYFLWGHTFLARLGGVGSVSKWAKSHFGSNRAKRNAFYTEVGRITKPSDVTRLVGLDLKESTPDEILLRLRS